MPQYLQKTAQLWVPIHSSQPLQNINSLNITVEGVAHLLKNIDPKKTGGPDGIPARFLRELSFEITPTLTLIYEASIIQGTLPEDWLTGLYMQYNFRAYYVFTYNDSSSE